MRILHAPSNVANQAWAMAQGMRTLGHEVEVWHHAPNPFSFQADRVIEVDDNPLAAVNSFLEALDRFDVFHLHLGRSLLPPGGGLPLLWDLPVLRALGKRVVFTFHGADVRHRAGEPDPWSSQRFGDAPDKAEEIAKRLSIIRTYANELTVLSVLNLSFVPDATYVPKAIELEAFPAAGPPRDERPVVLHVPSSRGRKGTEFVLAGLDELERRGLSFERRIVESVPHREIPALFADADVIVDNLAFGDYEVSTLEAMAVGRPVVTRIRREVRSAHPDLPAVDADPDTFVQTLGDLLLDPARRRELGAKGRPYVEATHSARAVAERLVPLYEGEARPVWRVFPEWTGLATDRKLEAYEERMQQLEVKVEELKRKLAERDSVVRDLKAFYGASKPLRILREARRRRRKT